IQIQSDNYLVASGFSGNSIAIARYQPNGTLDTTYGTSGITLTSVGVQAEAFGSVIDANNKVTVAGFSDANFVIARYATTGLLDSTFGISGVLTTSIGSTAQATSLALQTDGKFVAAGLSDSNMALVRYLPSNTPFVSILVPANGSTITSGHTTPVSGTSSHASATVAAIYNGSTFATVTTDSNGRWNAG